MKNIGVIVTIILAVLSGAMGYGQLQANQKSTREKVEEVKVDVEDVEEEVDDNEERLDTLEQYSVRQSVLIESSLKIIDRLEKKME